MLPDSKGRDLLPIRKGIRHGWNACTRIDLEEPKLFLGVLADVSRLPDFVGLARLVGRRRVSIDVVAKAY